MLKLDTVITKISRYLLPAWVFALALGLLPMAASPVQAAGSGVLSLTPASGSYTVGSAMTVSVYEDSGSEAVNAVEADLTYDQTKLQFGSVNTSVGPFDIGVPHNNGAGIVMISVAKIGGSVTGSQLVATISFTVLAGSGSSAISFNGVDSKGVLTSAITRQSDTANVWNQNTAGGNYTFTGATTTPPPTTPPPTNPSPTNPKTQPKSGSSAGSTTTTPAATTASVGQSYYVAINVYDAANKPVVGAEVSTGSFTVKTNAYGIATLTNLTAGTHEVTIKANGKTIKQTITVAAGGQPQDVQTFNVRVAGASTLAGRWYLYLLSLLLIVLVLGGGLSIKRMMISHSQRLAMEEHGMGNINSTQPMAPTVAPPPAAPPAAPSGGVSPQVFYPDPSSNSASKDKSDD